MTQVKLSKTRQLEADIEALKNKFKTATMFEKPKILEIIGEKSLELSKLILRQAEFTEAKANTMFKRLEALENRINDKWGVA